MSPTLVSVGPVMIKSSVAARKLYASLSSRTASGGGRPASRCVHDVPPSFERQTPLFDPLSHLVYVTRGDDVQTTIVNGQVLMRDRKVLTLDAEAVLKESRTWGEKVKAAVSAPAGATK